MERNACYICQAYRLMIEEAIGKIYFHAVTGSQSQNRDGQQVAHTIMPHRIVKTFPLYNHNILIYILRA